ncbi:SusC/RagA family TonB-linked outer membrane protein [Leeuwenhoekiella sp. ZYFB001]|uniref:SusC/RagA family TonB-linked outer membrane protein n=1 Tax=Leeuwenhoekiella sp. ZYFB001 TaxID=2719912 RepID=UPI00142F48A7|nr:TonB-dependent receptor [Leeuwenhoekiella sp. ZYFB001]
MKQQLRLIWSLVFLMTLNFAFSQTKTVSGTVTDQTGMPLPGVNVTVKNTTGRGTQTDFDGNFTIAASADETLVFSYMGFKPYEQLVGASATFSITLSEDTQSLDEVLVVAYGTAKKEDFTGSAVQVNGESLEQRPITNAISALDGAAAGVNVSAANGQPGSAPSIRIRGTGSYSASNTPLYIVDGVQFNGELSSINSNDIESLTVLKDAASTSLYGSRAANGVVLITTKSGRSGKPQISLKMSQGITSRGIPEYDRVSASEYYPLMWEALRNSLSMSSDTPVAEANAIASSTIYDELGQNPFNVANDQIVLEDGTLNPNASLLYAEDLDWLEPLVRTGVRTNLDFSYSGGTEKSDYYASVSYLKEDGYIINSNFKRLTARLNANTQVTDWIKTGLNISAADSDSNQAADAGSSSYVNPFRTTRYIGPIYSVHEHDPETGEYILDSDGNWIYDLGDNRVGGGGSGRNVIQETLLNVDRDKIFSFTSRAYAEFTFLQDFTFTVNGGIDKRFYSNESFDNPIVGDGAPDGRAGRTTSTRTTVNYNQLLNYSKTFGKHSVSALVGHESFDTEYEYLNGFRQNQIVEGNTELINFTTTNDLISYTSNQTTEGYFSRVNYDYDSRYYISGSYRRDGSSRFSKDARWGDFFSVGGAWRLDQEAFMETADWANLLKLRASYGEVGNDNLGGYYVSQSLFALDYNNASEGGILVDSPGNPRLQWETNIQTDAAIEFGLFNNRVAGTFEYYNRKSEDLLFDVPLPVSSGLDDYPDNIGSWVNSGFEFDVTVGIVRNSQFKWDFSINASTLKNEIKELSQEEIINGSKKLVVGGDIYDYWLREWYGVDPADGMALYIASPEAIEAGGSDLREIDGTTVTTNQNNANYNFVGKATPDVYGAFRNNFEYKGFQLGITFTYQLGGETYDSNYSGLMHSGTYGTALSTDILDRWQEPGDITNVPRLDAAQSAAFGAGSSRWLEKSDFLALRQVNLGYAFDAELVQKLGLTGANVYVSGENLFKLTARKGMDVGESFNGTTSNRFTPARVLSVGLNITL